MGKLACVIRAVGPTLLRLSFSSNRICSRRQKKSCHFIYAKKPSNLCSENQQCVILHQYQYYPSTKLKSEFLATCCAPSMRSVVMYTLAVSHLYFDSISKANRPFRLIPSSNLPSVVAFLQIGPFGLVARVTLSSIDEVSYLFAFSFAASAPSFAWAFSSAPLLFASSLPFCRRLAM